MKNLFTQILTVIVIIFTMISCKNNDGLDRIAPPSSTAFKNLRAEALQDITVTKTFDADEGIEFTTEKGTVVSISPGCLQTQGGDPIEGDVTLTFVEIYDIGNMVVTNKPLMGRNDDGDLLPLVTGGQFFVEVKKGNETLKSTCQYSLVVKAENTGGLDLDMSLWRGMIDEDGNLTWDNLQRDQGSILFPNEDNATYNVFSNDFGWTNVDKFWDRDDLTKLKVVVPNGYNGSNAAVYLAYEGEPGVLAHLDKYDPDERYFSEHFGFVPVGLNMHVIFTSESNGSIVYAIKQVSVVADMTITISADDLNTTTKANLVSMINALHN